MEASSLYILDVNRMLSPAYTTKDYGEAAVVVAKTVVVVKLIAVHFGTCMESKPIFSPTQNQYSLDTHHTTTLSGCNGGYG